MASTADLLTVEGQRQFRQRLRVVRNIFRRVLLAQTLNVRFLQTLNVRFLEVAEQHAGPCATTAGAQPTGCKQPVGSVTASAPRRLAGPGTRCAAEACC